MFGIKLYKMDPDPAHKLSAKPVWHKPLLCVQWKTPDDGQRSCPKHVEFYSKNKFEKLVHLVGLIIKIHHDARSPECQFYGECFRYESEQYSKLMDRAKITFTTLYIQVSFPKYFCPSWPSSARFLLHTRKYILSVSRGVLHLGVLFHICCKIKNFWNI